MSIAPSSPIKIDLINITWGEIEGLQQIKNAIHNAIVRALRLTKASTAEYIEKIVPDSSYGDYPPSYVSEGLKEGCLKILNDSLLHAISGGFKMIYELKYGFSASYAKYVNEMEGVQWSKAGTGGNFVERIDRFMKETWTDNLTAELSRSRAVRFNLGQYLGGFT